MMTCDWLAKNGISRDAYYYWFKRIKKSAIDAVNRDIPDTTTMIQPVPTFVELNAIKPASKSEDSLLSTTANTINTVSATISLRGMSISISDNASSDFLLKLVGALSHAE